MAYSRSKRLEVWKTFYGSLQKGLEKDLIALAVHGNVTRVETVLAPAGYLEVVVTKQ